MRSLPFVLLAACAEAAPPAPFVAPPEAYCAVPPRVAPALQPFEAHAFIAHAGGSPYGLTQREVYTNSREAFEVSYANGFRAFELDLMILADGEVIVAHDFREDEYGYADGTFPTMTRAELEHARWGDRYDVMFGDDLIALMVEHPDVWIVLDTKLDAHLAVAEALVALAPDDTVRDRLVPNVESEAHAQALAALYPFPERMIAVYRWGGDDAAQLDRMAAHDIDNIAMFWDRRWSPQTQARFGAAGHHVWVHTPADPQDIMALRAAGAGVYTDGWIACP